MLKELVRSLSDIMSISGFEARSGETLRGLLEPYFDEFASSPNGNYIFTKRCGKPDAPLLMLDAHYDEIGMLVTEIKDGGFIRVTSVGGLDTRIMLAGEVIIYADEPLYGVVCAKAPHLQKAGENKKLPPVNELLIDTGFTKEQLEQKDVRIGTPVGFKPVPCDLLNDKIAGKGFDNKSCIAAAVRAVELCGDDLDCDVALLCSCKEEIGALGGRIGAFNLEPDACLVLDVNLASVPDTPRHSTVKLGDGPSVSLSAVTDRILTRAILECAKENELKVQTVVEATDTGTNANIIALVRGGIPTAVVSIPLKNMHTYSEVISLSDTEDTAKLLAAFIKGGFTKWMNA